MTLNSTLLNSTLCSFLCIYLFIVLVSTIQNKWYGNVKYFIPENENSPFLQNHIYLLSYKWQNRLKEISHLRVAGRHLSSLKCSDSLSGSDFFHDVISWAMSVRLLGLAVMVLMLVRTNDTKERHHREEPGDQSQSSSALTDQSQRDLERSVLRHLTL